MDDAELKRLAEAVQSAQAAYGRRPIPRLPTRLSSHERLVKALFAFERAANPATILRLLRERDEARAKLASAQHDVEVYRDAVIEAREHGRALAKDRDCASAGEDLLYIFEDLHGLPALDADQGEGDGA